MKKRFISGLLSVMMVMSLCACNKEANGTNTTTTNTTVKEYTAEEYKQFITLSDYKNLKVEADASALEVTDEEVTDEIAYTLQLMAETEQITTGTVADGDTINMDYSGLLDGVAFAGGTATDTTYTVGGNFIESLDRQLIGLEVGKEYELPCTFPADYGKEELNGKDVIFVVTVNYIENKILPEYNDEFVKSYTAEFAEPLTTTAAFEEYIKTSLAEEKRYSYESEIYGKYMTQLLDASEIKGAPEDEVASTAEMIKTNAENEFKMYGSYYGVETFEAYITDMCGYESMEAFETEIKEYATEYVNEKMVITIIAAEEGIAISDDDVKAYAEELVTMYSYESLAALEESYGSSLYSDIRYELLYEAVYAKIVEIATAE